MRKMKLLITAVLVLTLLTGCSIEMIPMPSLPELGDNLSSLTGQVDYVNGRTCRIIITSGDSHFEEEDEIQLTFTNLEGSKKSVQIGDTVRFRYDYVSQVSEFLGSPHITVNQIRVD